ncbi:MAG: SPW repeat protein [Hyphomicrobiales bacterium]|nr:SPW repeat protein [Hyphomicrobiales bacterium]
MIGYPEKIDAWDGVNLALAAALVFAPWALGYSGDRAAVGSSVVAGLAIAACAIVAMTEFTRLFEEVDIALGALTAAAPWLIGFAHDRAAVHAHLAIGFLVMLLSAAELFLLRRRPPHASA